MSEVTFEEDPEWRRQQAGTYWNEAERMPVLVRLTMKLGLSRRQAYYVLFGILIVCSFVTFDVLHSTFFPNQNGKRIYLEDIPPQIQKTLPPDILRQIPSRHVE